MPGRHPPARPWPKPLAAWLPGSGGCDNGVKMWNLATNQQQQVAQHAAPVRHCFFIRQVRPWAGRRPSGVCGIQGPPAPPLRGAFARQGCAAGCSEGIRPGGHLAFGSKPSVIRAGDLVACGLLLASPGGCRRPGCSLPAAPGKGSPHRFTPHRPPPPHPPFARPRR